MRRKFTAMIIAGLALGLGGLEAVATRAANPTTTTTTTHCANPAPTPTTTRCR